MHNYQKTLPKKTKKQATTHTTMNAQTTHTEEDKYSLGAAGHLQS
jgi:hypothetical protein